MSAIELHNVSFAYDDSTVIFEKINFTAEYGEVALLAGHSGEGKSTLLSLLSGIIPNIVTGNLSGEILIDGQNIVGKKMGEICRKIGVVLQNADSQIIQKKVEDEIAFGCENLAFTPEKIQKQIEIVCKLLKLEKEWNTHTLSGGQKQRLITASTLAMGQKILILDEPLANLDTVGATHLMNTLRSLSKAGYCVLVVEHRLDMVLSFVDTVWHIGNKKVEKIDDKEGYLTSQTTSIKDTSATHERGNKLITMQNVGFSIQNKEILQDISFDIFKGERLLLLGENGCGKTTLMRLIASLNKPTNGKITHTLGIKIKSKKWFQKVGVIYQNPDYQLFMPTVKQEIEFGAESKEYAQIIMDKFALTNLKDRHPQSLSEGQKRRVSIAAVCATKPEILLLDEPTVGQDYEGLRRLVELLNDLHEQTGGTMITVTHDVRCCKALCDRAIWIKDKTIYKTGGKELCELFFERNQKEI